MLYPIELGVHAALDVVTAAERWRATTVNHGKNDIVSQESGETFYLFATPSLAVIVVAW